MSLVVKWDDVPEASGYRLYWGTTKFTLSNLPTNKVDIAAGVNEYEIVDVIRQTVYWFVIETLTEGGGSIFGQIFPLGYFPDTGPGPSKLLRGDWEFGFFGEVDPAEVGTADEVYSQLVMSTADNPIKPTVTDYVYLKCIVNGKIIFIPSKPFGSYNLLGNVGHYVSIGACGDTNLDDTNSPILTLKGRDYQHRLPRASNTKPTTAVVTLDVSSNDVLMSEVGMLAALQVSPAEMESAKNAETLNNATVYRRLGDYPNLYDIVTLHRSAMFQAAAYALYSYAVVASTGGIQNKVWTNSTNKPYLPVLELLF